MIELPAQDRVHAPVTDRTRSERPFGSGFHAGDRIALAEADDAQAGAITHLRMRKGRQDLFHYLAAARANRRRRLDHAGRRPVQMGPMRRGPMLSFGDSRVCLVRAHVQSDALALVEDLDGRGRGVNFHDPSRQLIGHAIEAVVELDVIVEVNGGLRPLREIEPLHRQRVQRWPVQLQEQALPCAFALLDGPLIEPVQQLADGAVQFGQREELAMTQSGQYLPLGDLHADLYFGIGNKRVMQTVVMVAYNFSPSRTLSIP